MAATLDSLKGKLYADHDHDKFLPAAITYDIVTAHINQGFPKIVSVWISRCISIDPETCW